MHDISISAEAILSIFGKPITNSVLTTFVVSSLIILVSVIARGKLKLIPSKLQSALELPVEALFNLTKQVAPHNFEEFFPLVATIFIFILISNWFALIPGLGGIGIAHIDSHTNESILTPLFRGATADINTAIALALIAVIATHYFGIKHLGIKVHLKKYFDFRNPIAFFVGLLELVGEFSKVISFSFRLFGNIFAGEVLLIVTVGLVPLFLPVPFLGLEIFVGFIQALVFAMLTLVFSSMTVAKH